MKIQLNVKEIKEAVEDFINKQGIDTSSKVVVIDISGARKDTIVADIIITDKSLEEEVPSDLQEELLEAIEEPEAPTTLPWDNLSEEEAITEDTILFEI